MAIWKTLATWDTLSLVADAVLIAFTIWFVSNFRVKLSHFLILLAMCLASVSEVFLMQNSHANIKVFAATNAFGVFAAIMFYIFVRKVYPRAKRKDSQ